MPVLVPSFVQNMPTSRSEPSTNWRFIAPCGPHSRLWSRVGFPFHRKQHNGLSRGMLRIPFVHRVCRHLPLLPQIGRRCNQDPVGIASKWHASLPSRRQPWARREKLESCSTSVNLLGGGDDKERLSLRVQVVLPRKTFDRLIALSKHYGDLSFSHIIRLALTLFDNLTKARIENEPLMLRQKSDGTYVGISPVLFTA